MSQYKPQSITPSYFSIQPTCFDAGVPALADSKRLASEIESRLSAEIGTTLHSSPSWQPDPQTIDSLSRTYMLECGLDAECIEKLMAMPEVETSSSSSHAQEPVTPRPTTRHELTIVEETPVFPRTTDIHPSPHQAVLTTPSPAHTTTMSTPASNILRLGLV